MNIFLVTTVRQMSVLVSRAKRPDGLGGTRRQTQPRWQGERHHPGRSEDNERFSQDPRVPDGVAGGRSLAGETVFLVARPRRPRPKARRLRVTERFIFRHGGAPTEGLPGHCKRGRIVYHGERCFVRASPQRLFAIPRQQRVAQALDSIRSSRMANTMVVNPIQTVLDEIDRAFEQGHLVVLDGAPDDRINFARTQHENREWGLRGQVPSVPVLGMPLLVFQKVTDKELADAARDQQRWPKRKLILVDADAEQARSVRRIAVVLVPPVRPDGVSATRMPPKDAGTHGSVELSGLTPSKQYDHGNVRQQEKPATEGAHAEPSRWGQRGHCKKVVGLEEALKIPQLDLRIWACLNLILYAGRFKPPGRSLFDQNGFNLPPNCPRDQSHTRATCEDWIGPHLSASMSDFWQNVRDRVANRQFDLKPKPDFTELLKPWTTGADLAALKKSVNKNDYPWFPVDIDRHPRSPPRSKFGALRDYVHHVGQILVLCAGDRAAVLVALDKINPNASGGSTPSAGGNAPGQQGVTAAPAGAEDKSKDQP
jgi:hypothetical protein